MFGSNNIKSQGINKKRERELRYMCSGYTISKTKDLNKLPELVHRIVYGSAVPLVIRY